MDDFKVIGIEDKEIIEKYIIPSDERDCDLSFANLCSWQFITESSYAVMDGLLVIRFAHPKWGHEYFMPMNKRGEADRAQALQVLEQLAREADTKQEPLCLRGVSPALEEELAGSRLGNFNFVKDRDYFDYVYQRQDLAELKGKHYQPKRNHVNKFKREYNFTAEPLTQQAVAECLEFEASWCRVHGYEEDENILNERQAMVYAFEHWERLGLRGLVIRVEGNVAAFTFGAPINHDTFGVHFEKADIRIDGAYSAVNQFFAASLPEEYVYLNREEDLGIPGLRQAKLSYQPAFLLEKIRAVKK